MRTITGEVAAAIMVAISGAGVATGMARTHTTAADQLQPLVEASVRRLAIAEQVALAKWDSHDAVEDALREAQVISAAVIDGEAKGLDWTGVASFFRAQIEANKLVQYSLLAEWRRDGGAPSHQSVDLVTTLRPELDQLQEELVQELASTAVIRQSPMCPDDVARAVKGYLATHQYGVAPLQIIALDRAMAATCMP
jgi:chorismate mutase